MAKRDHARKPRTRAGADAPKTELQATSSRYYRRYPQPRPTRTDTARAVAVALLVLAIFFLFALMLLLQAQLGPMPTR